MRPSSSLNRQRSMRKLAALTESYPANFHGNRHASVDSIIPSAFRLISVESTLTKNRPVTLVQSTLTKTLDLKSIRINTYKKTGGRGAAHPSPEPKSPVRRASAVRKMGKVLTAVFATKRASLAKELS
jgi:hypothetical protein